MPKQEPLPIERRIFTPEEFRKIKKHLELLTNQHEIIGCLNNYSESFVDWIIIIREAVLEMIERKESQNVSCDREQEMLDNFSDLFAKLYRFSSLFSDWYKELAFDKELTEEIVKQGHS
jgi:hypothetical protein